MAIVIVRRTNLWRVSGRKTDGRQVRRRRPPRPRTTHSYVVEAQPVNKLILDDTNSSIKGLRPLRFAPNYIGLLYVMNTNLPLFKA